MPRPELFRELTQELDDGITEKEEEPVAMETEAEPTSYQLLSGMHNKFNAMQPCLLIVYWGGSIRFNSILGRSKP